MALLFLNLETTFNVSIRRADQDVKESDLFDANPFTLCPE